MRTEFLVSLLVLLLTCILYSQIHFELSTDYFNIEEYKPILILENIGSLLTPLFIFIYILVSSSLLFYIFEIQSSFKSSFIKLGISFVPLLIVTTILYLAVILNSDLRASKDLETISNAETFIGLKFSNLKYLTTIGYIITFVTYTFFQFKDRLESLKFKVATSIWLPILAAYVFSIVFSIL